MIDWQGFFDSRLTNTAAGDLRGAIISGSRAIVYATDDAIANDLANGIKNKLFAFLLGVYAHPELKGMLCGEEYVIRRMDDQVGSVVGERVEALLTVSEPAYLYARMIRNGTAVLLVLTDGTTNVGKDKLIGVVDKALAGLASA